MKAHEDRLQQGSGETTDQGAGLAAVENNTGSSQTETASDYMLGYNNGWRDAVEAIWEQLELLRDVRIVVAASAQASHLTDGFGGFGGIDANGEPIFGTEPKRVTREDSLLQRVDAAIRVLAGTPATTEVSSTPAASPALSSSIQDTSVVHERSEISATLPSGVDLIATERQRQMAVEGWTPEHDDSHEGAELLQAALWYLDDGADYIFALHLPPWPFEPDAWKSSTDAVRQLVKAGALIAAEIDRMQRRALEAKE